MIQVIVSLMLLSLAHNNLIGMNGGPMNSEWFYSEKNPYKSANDLLQNKDWKNAETAYLELLEKKTGSEYDQDMARLNLASCQMAQEKATEHWNAFDPLVDIQNISLEQACSAKTNVLVRSNLVGIGDIFHFFKALHILKKRTACNVIFSVRNFLKPALQNAAAAYGITLIGESDPQPNFDYQTHLIALLGHCNIKPQDISPENIILTAPEKAIARVKEVIDPILADEAIIGVVFLGENRPATLIGGKQLPRNPSHHGRQLDSKPFGALLKKHPELMLLDCGTEKGRVTLEDSKNRVIVLPREEQAFDTIIALGLCMNADETSSIIGFGADTGPTNVFTRALSERAQGHMTFIIPNSEEYDMRMEGNGASYTQMISKCRVYKCDKPEDQEFALEQAFYGMVLDNTSE